MPRITVAVILAVDQIIIIETQSSIVAAVLPCQTVGVDGLGKIKWSIVQVDSRDVGRDPRFVMKLMLIATVVGSNGINSSIPKINWLVVARRVSPIGPLIVMTAPMS